MTVFASPARRLAGLSALLALMAAGSAAAAEPCGATAICGLKNPEDVVRLDRTPFAIASRLARDESGPGGFYAVDLARRLARPLAPDVSARATDGDAACPGPPDARKLITHGLDVRPAGKDRWRLLAVSHGGREAVEIFDVRRVDDGLSLVWRGCVPIPREVAANAVAALPDGLVVSSFGDPGGDAALRSGGRAGFVERWSASQGWRRVPGSEFAADNGVAVSPDGATLYVNSWGDGVLHMLPLARGGRAGEVKLGDFHPDNVHLRPDGALVIAGQVGTPDQVLACGPPVCGLDSEVVVVDPDRRRVLQHWRVPASAGFGAASTAVADGDVYWLSSFLGDRLVSTRDNARPAGR